MREKIRTQPQKYPDYVMEGNNLYRNIPHRACVPKVEGEPRLTGGWPCRKPKTIARLTARCYWPGMHRDARAHVRGCETFMRFKPNQMQMAGKMLTQVPEEPWATVCADFVGPLLRSKHGNQMLLVLINRFSKWTEVVPLRSATAKSLKKAFRERIIVRYGLPEIVITDNGVQFARKNFQGFPGALPS